MSRERLNQKIGKDLESNIKILSAELGIGISFDVLLRRFKIGRRNVALLFLDGFANAEVNTLILQTLMATRREELSPRAVDKIFKERLPYVEVDTVSTLQAVVDEVLAGPMAMLVDGAEEALIIDTRQYPDRTPEEPDIEKITRGSRDGFVETMLFNVTLIRRRLRDPGLRAEVIKVGERSSTDIALMYINDITNPELVRKVKARLEKIKVDGLPMAEKSVEEFITEGFWNPFPEVRYTERPDVAAIHLLEGHIIIIVDTSPSVIIAPVTLFHHIQHAEEFRQAPILGIYVRWVRILGILLSVFLVPLWLIFAEQPEMLPPALGFIGPKEPQNIPLFIQFIIAHFGLDLLRMASIHTPSPMATALGLVGALLIGQIAVEVGFFSNEVLLYTGIVAIGVFSTPSWELSMANRLMLLVMLILTGLFKLPGFFFGVALIAGRLLTTHSFGVPYLWPLIPFNGRAFIDVFIRRPIPVGSFRPAILAPRDKDRPSG